MTEQLSSDDLLCRLRKRAALTENLVSITPDEVLALVGCAEALRALNQYPGYIKDRGPAMYAWANAQTCLAKLEAL